MATLTSQQMSQAGLVPVMSAASAGGDFYTPGSTTFLAVKNSDASAHTVTVVTTAEAFGQVIANVVVSIPAGALALLGPYEPGEVEQPGSGLASILYSGVTGMSVAAVEL